MGVFRSFSDLSFLTLACTAGHRAVSDLPFVCSLSSGPFFTFLARSLLFSFERQTALSQSKQPSERRMHPVCSMCARVWLCVC
uniref:Putative secreted protein n=1 Tax=Anopheles marajoara TaxID=58244 RepID=A0A2M4CBD8_9DIPT